MKTEFINSSKIKSELTALIKQQSLQYDTIKDSLQKFKTEIKKSKEENYQNAIERLITEMNDKRKRSCGYIKSNWSFKLVHRTSSYRIWIQII